MSTPGGRSGHPYFMHDGIYAQPGALRLVGRGNARALADASARVRRLDRVIVTGVGTSWHAALVGELLFAQLGGFGVRARALHSFELARYWPAPDARTALILISHRGGNQSTHEALARARSGAALTVAITGKGADPRLAADHLLTTVDQERSEAHTVSYTCALALLATLAASVGGDEDIVGELDAVPDKLALLLGQESWEELASRFATRRRFYFVGGGPNTATAYEAALKMSETSYVTAMGLNCEEFLHGPWAALEPEDVVVLIAPAGPSYERCVTVARVVAEVGAALIALVAEADREISRVAAETIAIPEVPELLSPIVTVAPLQLLSYHTAVARGTNPDTLRTTEEAHGRARRVLTR